MRVGFVGLGNMGAHMARRLVEAGHEVVCYDTNAAAQDRLVAAGARGVRSLPELSEEVDTVFCSLPTPAIVKKVICNEDGLSGTALRVVVDLSTTQIGGGFFGQGSPEIRGIASTIARRATIWR